MTPAQIIDHMYRNFNARRIDDVFDLLHAEVDWPNGWESGRVRGKAAVRVHQVVKDLRGKLLGDEQLDHVYEMQDGLIRSMEIRK